MVAHVVPQRRSLRRFPALLCAVVLTLCCGSGRTGETTLKQLGVTFNGPQAVSWIDKDCFAVGRWDGTLSVFRMPAAANEFGPVLLHATAAPSRKAIQMVARLRPHAFVTSNDESSIVVWDMRSNQCCCSTAQYLPKFGWAVSGTALELDGKECFVSGHESGDILIWQMSGMKPVLLRSFSLRSPNPIKWEYQTWHIRAVVPWKANTVVTGSEDGDICLVRLPGGEVLSRIRYNPAALRGINSVSICGDQVAVGNCCVGRNDRNFWLYRLSEKGFDRQESIRLVKDDSRPQVFTFAVQLAMHSEELDFFASTEEGQLWGGTVVNGKLHVSNELCQEVSCKYGAALAFQEQPWTLLTASHYLKLFSLGPKPVEKRPARVLVPSAKP